ncbi:MAG: peptidoglycan DD-metalloendopeptidase family protein [Candidatus Omnitrophica bacterium]|nr:peptidoglycan DD-metalloendopeptidase family protein [Candidatus Omnitrophota bacterium]
MSIKSVKKMKKINLIEMFFLAILVSGCSLTIGTGYPNKNSTSYGSYHIVKKGEDLYRISRYYGVSVAKIESANEMSSSNIQVGERLFIPGAGKKQPSYTLAPSVSQSNYSGQARSTPETTLEQNTIPETPYSSIIKTNPFVWPAKGKIIGRYGEFGNQGIDIEARNETPVIAAMNGVVEYIGWTEKYGQTIIIANNEGIYTIYGHDITIKVNQGQKVKKSRIIAKINSKQTEGYLHFEIRENTTPVNPLDYLPSK